MVARITVLAAATLGVVSLPAARTVASTAALRPCLSAQRVSLKWTAKAPNVANVFVSASLCPPPPGCVGAVPGQLVTDPPVTIRLTDADGRTIEAFAGDAGANRSGCPGTDTYVERKGRTKLTFGIKGLTTMVARVNGVPAPGVAAFRAPITVTVTDGTGLLFTATVNSCVKKNSSLLCR